jgi:hypothetical protein
MRAASIAAKTASVVTIVADGQLRRPVPVRQTPSWPGRARPDRAMVIASPNTKVNRSSRSPRNAHKQAVFAILRAVVMRGVHVRFIAILKLPFKFYGSYDPNKPANGERVFRKNGNRICGIRVTQNNGCIKQDTDGSRARRGGTSES